MQTSEREQTLRENLAGRNYLTPPAGPKTIAEPGKDLPIAGEFDVAVFGGGPAGVCAAVAAARMGAKVALIERNACFGGNATAAAVNVWHSLYGMDGKTQVIGGLAEECVRRMQRRGAAENRLEDGETGAWTIDTEDAKLMFDDLVIESGVRILLHTTLAGVICEGRKIKAVAIEGKSGRQALIAQTYIDCTGDADLLRRAGAATDFGDDNNTCQPPTLTFTLQGIAPKSERFHIEKISAELIGTRNDYLGYDSVAPMWEKPPPGRPNQSVVSAVRVPGIDASDSRSLTRAEIEGRYQMRWAIEKFKGYKGWENIQLCDISQNIGVRESHRIIADYTLDRESILSGKEYPDCVAQGTWPIDIHNPDGPGTRLEFLDGTTITRLADNSREKGRWDGKSIDDPTRDTLCWQVPYRALIAKDFDNALAAGRCIGADYQAAGAIRVMITAMQLGEAAGIGAGLAMETNDIRRISIPKLLEQLRSQGGKQRPKQASSEEEAMST